MSTTVTSSSKNGGVASYTKTNRGAPHQSPPRAPSLVQVIHGDPEFDQIQVQDWDKESDEIEAAAKEDELIRVQQEIEGLWQEQETIMRQQEITQRTEARRQHINRESVRLVELQYTVDILCQQEQYDSRMSPNLLRGTGKLIGGDLDIVDEGSEQR
jgi:hypothetical protein